MDRMGASRVKCLNVEKCFLRFKVSNICVWLRKEKICHLALFMNLIRIRSNMIAMQASNLLSRYNDMSPLENHHCAVSFKILSSPECNIFTNLSTEEFKEVKIYHSFRSLSNLLKKMLVQVRGDMIVLILATDMARHAEILDNFRQKLDNFDYSSEVNYPNEKYST